MTLESVAKGAEAVKPTPKKRVGYSYTRALCLTSLVFCSNVRSATLSTWGDGRYNQTNIPAGITNVVAISANWGAALALRSDGTVASWGAQTNVFEGVSNIVGVAAGSFSYLAWKSDGTVLSSGGYIGPPPSGLSNVVSLAAGDLHALALKSDGTLVAWGDNYYGETSVPPGLTGVVAIAANHYHSLALRQDGTVSAWGEDEAGESTPPTYLADVIAIAAGEDHSLALRRDGTVVAWGGNDSGEATVPLGLTNVVAISAGYFSSSALTGGGKLVSWGWDGYGQTDVPLGLSNITEISGSGGFSVALRSDSFPLEIRVPPKNQTVAVGSKVTFRVLVSGNPPLTFSWQKNGQPIVPFGFGSSTLTITNAQESDGGQYSVLVTNRDNPGVTSSNAVLVVSSSLPPRIDVEPANQIVGTHGDTFFSVCASGSSPLSFQWFYNVTNPLAKATNALLTLSNVQQSQAGKYSVVVSNSFGSALSREAILAVTPSIAPFFAWGTTGGGTNYERGQSCTVDPDGNCLVTGVFDNKGQFGPFILTNAGNDDIFIAKYYTDGSCLWAEGAGGGGFDNGAQIAADASGRFFVVGSLVSPADFSGEASPMSLGQAIFVASYEDTGALDWLQLARTNSSVTNTDYGEGVAVDGSGNIFVLGTFGPNYYLAKMSSSGQVLWSRTAGTNYQYQQLYGVGVNSAGDNAITGYFFGTAPFGNIVLTAHSGGDGVVARLDAEGNFLWVNQLWCDGGSFSGPGTTPHAAVDPTGNTYISGSFSLPAHFGGSLIVTNLGSSDGYIAKYNSSGALVWVQTLSGPNANYINTVVSGPSNNVYIAGRFTGGAALGPVLLSTTNSQESFVAELNPDGVPQWVQLVGKPEIWDIAPDSAGNVFVTGLLSGPTTVGGVTVRNDGAPGLFVAKLELRPDLVVNQFGSQVVLSWPKWAPDFHLETANTWPFGNWSPVLNAPWLTANGYVITNYNSNSEAFFRLARPQ